MADPAEVVQSLRDHVDSLEAKGVDSVDATRDIVIECPDCGKQVVNDGKCPKCAGASWVPAGHAGGVPERMKRKKEGTGTYPVSAEAASTPPEPTTSQDERGTDKS